MGIQIKSFFSEWHEVSFAQAKRFFNVWKIGNAKVKEHFSKHFRGITYEELAS